MGHSSLPAQRGTYLSNISNSNSTHEHWSKCACGIVQPGRTQQLAAENLEKGQIAHYVTKKEDMMVVLSSFLIRYASLSLCL